MIEEVSHPRPEWAATKKPTREPKEGPERAQNELDREKHVFNITWGNRRHCTNNIVIAKTVSIVK